MNHEPMIARAIPREKKNRQEPWQDRADFQDVLFTNGTVSLSLWRPLRVSSMVKFVKEHEVAFDPITIVFPGLRNCLGLIYQTETGLFAMHIMVGPSESPSGRPSLPPSCGAIRTARPRRA